MPRLRNHLGVVVSASADTAAVLGSDWKPVAAAAEKPRQVNRDGKPKRQPPKPPAKTR